MGLFSAWRYFERVDQIPVAELAAAGVRTILVRPQSRRDLWYTHIMRVGERLVLRGKTFEDGGER